MLQIIKNVLENMPADWLNLTTHRLDIYNEELAKNEFLGQFQKLVSSNDISLEKLVSLPTAYDYIRLGHPLSCILEWLIASTYDMDAQQVISFSSTTMPVFAILRENKLRNKATRILYSGALPEAYRSEVLKRVYGYEFETCEVGDASHAQAFEGSTVLIQSTENILEFQVNPNIDFAVNINKQIGSVLLINGDKNKDYMSKIQHVRRRETIAMTPVNTLTALQAFVHDSPINNVCSRDDSDKMKVQSSVRKITNSTVRSLVASSGLSTQYAIVMGLIDDAMENYPHKSIKIVVPTNCYGGTNDQARRVAAGNELVEVVDLAVDGDDDMVDSLEMVLSTIAEQDAIPFIIAEIPTNPRVEVPDLQKLEEVLAKKRTTKHGKNAIEPVFILDQTFCPNVHFLGTEDVLSSVKTISYVSGSKFPSGGKCTAGYCVGNEKTAPLMDKIALHLELCDNEATALQYEILALQMPSMNQRISAAYENTRDFVAFITDVLPAAKINFVSEGLASEGFTPSVFSLDLPTKGSTFAEQESYKRALNLKLINLMITEITDESKFCVSYGQLKGCYWTVPATSTQGTTKEGDKDYIVRASLSPDMDLEKHKEVFREFVESM